MCQYITSKKSNLQRHLLVHTGEKAFKCNRFSPLMGYGNRPFILQTKLYKCDLCSYVSYKKINLQNHSVTHTGGAFQKHNIRRSYISGKQRKLHKCSFCDYITCRTDHLKTHILTHTGQKPFQCALCDKRCTTKYNLKSHFRVHLKASHVFVPV
ncbi:hypothetical protein TNIN_245561 [Trichonephila inaurata madagascariensis]|uniref:C2H2-type domain-containing protein n=1 Tax=Trichonephila inaurata madagascariensis TaxID=2747483 RepID=A0A8X6YTY4_9ARAC|nr:hypothetical protein TNIN_245561 [Trichonephila inaurata madagascariensis]